MNVKLPKCSKLSSSKTPNEGLLLEHRTRYLLITSNFQNTLNSSTVSTCRKQFQYSLGKLKHKIVFPPTLNLKSHTRDSVIKKLAFIAPPPYSLSEIFFLMQVKYAYPPSLHNPFKNLSFGLHYHSVEIIKLFLSLNMKDRAFKELFFHAPLLTFSGQIN